MNKWYEHAEERAVATERLTAALGAFRSLALRRAFNSLAELLAGPPDVLVRAVAHMVNAELARALRTWVLLAAS